MPLRVSLRVLQKYMDDILEDLEFEELLVKLVNKTPKRFRDLPISKSNMLRRLKRITGFKQTIVMDIFKLYVKLGVIVLVLENEVETSSKTFTARFYMMDLVLVSTMATRTGMKAKVNHIVWADYIRPKDRPKD